MTGETRPTTAAETVNGKYRLKDTPCMLPVPWCFLLVVPGPILNVWVDIMRDGPMSTYALPRPPLVTIGDHQEVPRLYALTLLLYRTPHTLLPTLLDLTTNTTHCSPIRSFWWVVILKRLFGVLPTLVSILTGLPCTFVYTYCYSPLTMQA